MLLRSFSALEPFYILIIIILITGCDDQPNIHTPSGKTVDLMTLPNGLAIGKYELLQFQWNAIMDTNPSSLSIDSLPVENITWFDAVEYCNQLSAKENLQQCYTTVGDSIFWDTLANGYRLPTRAEWEYACHANTKTDFYTGNMTYHGCDTLDAALDEAGWYCANSDNRPHKSGRKKPNAFGLYDMHGNVWEWCWDWSNESNITRTLKGGSWYNASQFARVNVLYDLPPHMSFSIYGMRVARGPKRM